MLSTSGYPHLLSCVTYEGDLEALLADRYGGKELEGPYKTIEQKLERFNYFKNQKYQTKTLQDAYPDVSVTQHSRRAVFLKRYSLNKKTFGHYRYWSWHRNFRRIHHSRTHSYYSYKDF